MDQEGERIESWWEVIKAHGFKVIEKLNRKFWWAQAWQQHWEDEEDGEYSNEEVKREQSFVKMWPSWQLRKL